MAFISLTTAGTTAQVVASLAAALSVYAIYKIFNLLYDELTSPLRHIPGPPNPSLMYGILNQLSESVNGRLEESWIREYGPIIQFRGFLGGAGIMTMDLKANNHVLIKSYDYVKPGIRNDNLRKIFGNGNGLLSAEGDVHKNQRKVLNPAFGPQQIRGLTEIFVEKSFELRDIWSKEIAKQHDGVARIDCLPWMSRTTLDIIGLAGFNYNFNALTSDIEKNDLMRSFSIVFKAGQKPALIPILRTMYPFLRFLPSTDDAVFDKAATVMNDIGTGLVERAKSSLADDKAWSRRDVLSLLVHANTMEAEAQQISDKEMMGQIPTFIIAGHETTSTTMAWALYALTQHKDVQRKLREEISELSTDNPSMDDLNSFPYLDAVMRETLRRYPPVGFAQREAVKDDCIPLSKPFTDTKGIVRNEIRIRKGQLIFVPISLINRDKSIWGEDAKEFKPERWMNIPDAASSVPGVWANLMTFIGGPRACIGFRFSLVETKALLFTLIRAFEFDLAVPGKDIGSRSTGFQRPILLTDPNNSNQMPLYVRPVSSGF